MPGCRKTYIIFIMGFWGKGREQIFTEAINYYTINQVGVNRHGGTAVFCRQTKDLMVKCSQTCGAPQAVLLHGKIRSRRILSLRLLYHKSSRCKPTRRYAVFCRQTKDLMVKCSQTCGAPQAVLLHGKIRSQRILSLRLLYHTSPTPATLSPLFLMNSREFLSHHIYGRI